MVHFIAVWHNCDQQHEFWINILIFIIKASIKLYNMIVHSEIGMHLWLV